MPTDPNHVRRSTWLDAVLVASGGANRLTAQQSKALEELDDALFDIWQLGGNIILQWTRERNQLRFLAIRHSALLQHISRSAAGQSDFITRVLGGGKFAEPRAFADVAARVGTGARIVSVECKWRGKSLVPLVSSLVSRYGVSLVKARAAILLDIVGFSLVSPLEQVAMLHSLSLSVNCAYRQLLGADTHIQFARTTTGDGFYIWNRARTGDANFALYKLLMLTLADNALARKRAGKGLVPQLRAAFHVAEQYEFHHVEAVNPTTFSYIVGQVTIDLARFIENALPGQIVIGDFNVGGADAGSHGTPDFLRKTAASLEQLEGLSVGGDHIEDIRCYLTGTQTQARRYRAVRYPLLDKHGLTRFAYNAKINIYWRHRKAPLYLGLQHKDVRDHQ